MNMPVLLRALLIAIFALFGGPQPAAAGGDHTVICGADGLKRVVVFNFETGAPEPAPIGIEDCEKCLIALAAPGEADYQPVSPVFAPERAPAIAAALRATGAPRAPSARAPPSV